MTANRARAFSATQLAALAAFAVVAILAAACVVPLGARHSAVPAPPAGYVADPAQLRAVEVRSNGGMVVCGAPEAAEAGAAVLAAGGNAVDAAITTAFALGSAEPVTSGIGGQAFILIRFADGRTVAVDGSCTVPALANPTELQAIRRAGDVRGYQSVATPGALAALAYTLERYGTIPLARALAPAIDIAEFGFHMNTSELANVETYAAKLRRGGYLADVFLKGFTDVWPPDHVFCQGDLAQTLRRIAAVGPADFYRGRIADEIAADMRRHGGYVRKDDLVQVQPVERRPLHGSYRGLDVITFPYPGGGGALLEMLGILDAYPSALLRGESLDRLHLLLEAGRITLHDAFTPSVPLPLPLYDRELADPKRAARRARLIRFDRALSERELGQASPEPFFVVGTTQVSVADRAGNVVALTQTVGASLGSGVATRGLGFAYNSNLDAFDYVNRFSPFYLAPGKVPMTTLTPTIVLKNGKPFLIFGSAGSERVVPSMAVVLSAIADRGEGLRRAVATPRALWGFGWRGERYAYLELAGEITPKRVSALERQGFFDMYRQGFPARWIDLMVFGGTNAVMIDPATREFIGVADPRRQGVAVAPPPRR